MKTLGIVIGEVKKSLQIICYLNEVFMQLKLVGIYCKLINASALSDQSQQGQIPLYMKLV